LHRKERFKTEEKINIAVIAESSPLHTAKLARLSWDMKKRNKETKYKLLLR